MAEGRALHRKHTRSAPFRIARRDCHGYSDILKQRVPEAMSTERIDEQPFADELTSCSHIRRFERPLQLSVGYASAKFLDEDSTNR
jgi:hypothetical protein